MILFSTSVVEVVGFLVLRELHVDEVTHVEVVEEVVRGEVVEEVTRVVGLEIYEVVLDI